MADFVAQGFVVGETRRVHVPVRASVRTCLYDKDMKDALYAGIIRLYLSFVFLVAVVFLMFAVAYEMAMKCVLNFHTASDGGDPTSSVATEMTNATWTPARPVYSPVPTDDSVAPVTTHRPALESVVLDTHNQEEIYLPIQV
jgi:hypothetical protein